MYQQYIAGIDKERAELQVVHDDVGSRLSYLKRLLIYPQWGEFKTAHEVEVLIGMFEFVARTGSAYGACFRVATTTGKINQRSKGIHQEIKLQVHQYQGLSARFRYIRCIT